MIDAKTIIERLAIVYSDGSIGIHREQERLSKVAEQCADDNKRQTDPQLLARVAKVRVEIVDFIEVARKEKCCPTCGRTL